MANPTDAPSSRNYSPTPLARNSTCSSPILISSGSSSYMPLSPVHSPTRQTRPSTHQTAGYDMAENETQSTGVATTSGRVGTSRTTNQRFRRQLPKRTTSRKAQKERDGLVQVTRQCWVTRVETLTEPPENWSVPEDDDAPVAYLVDLMNNEIDYKDERGAPLAMSAIIRDACIDAWENDHLTQEISASKANIKALEAQKKELKAGTGVHVRRAGVADKGKVMPAIVADREEHPPLSELADREREIREREIREYAQRQAATVPSSSAPSPHIPKLDLELEPPPPLTQDAAGTWFDLDPFPSSSAHRLPTNFVDDSFFSTYGGLQFDSEPSFFRS